MEVTIDISERDVKRLKDITDKYTDESAIKYAIKYTLDNY